MRVAIFPAHAEVIYAEWVTREGGVCVYAFTDAKRDPFIGVSPLNRMGRPNGLPCWMRRSRFASDLVIGFRNETPIIIRIYVKVYGLGLELIVRQPRELRGHYERKVFKPWDSEPPSMGFGATQVAEHWPNNMFPWEIPE